MSGAGVVIALLTGFECRERQDVSSGEIFHMHVVADACAIGCVVIRAENRDGGFLTERHLQYVGDQVCFGIVILADGSVLGGAGRVEVSQGNESETPGYGGVGERPFHGELRASVWAARLAAAVLVDWHAV